MAQRFCKYGMDTCVWADQSQPQVCARCEAADSYEPDEIELAGLPADDDEPQPKGGTDNGR